MLKSICIMIGRRVTGSVPKGRDLEFMVRTADGASLITGGKASENRSKILNAWETCIFYCNRLADEGCSLEEDEIFNSSARYQMPKDALVMDEADSVQHSRPARPLFRFRYADALLMKAEAMERNDGDGRAEYNMVRAHAGLPARRSSLANILEDRQVVLAGETGHRQDLIRFGSSSSPRIFAVLFSPLFVLFHRLPDTSAKPCLQWQVGSEQRI